MDKLERAHRLHKILKERRMPVSVSELCERLECESRTVTRLIADMRRIRILAAGGRRTPPYAFTDPDFPSIEQMYAR